MAEYSEERNFFFGNDEDVTFSNKEIMFQLKKELELEQVQNTKRNTLGKPCFSQRRGTTDYGKDFEFLALSNFLLKLINDDNVKNFQVSVNDEHYGVFDDIICEVAFQDGRISKYAMQLKHVNNEKKYGCTIALSKNSGHYSIHKYFLSFQENRQSFKDYNLLLLTNWKPKLENGEEITLDFSNPKIGLTDFCITVRIKAVEEMLDEFFVGKCFKFEIVNMTNSNNYLEYEAFFRHFYLLTDQMNVYELKTEIVSFFSKFSPKDNLSSVFLRQINTWSIYEGTKLKLTKPIIEQVLAVSLIDSSIQPVSFNNDNLTSTAKLFCDIVSQSHLTIFKEESLEKVQKLWGTSQFCNLSPSDFKQINKINQRYLITDCNFINQKYFHTLTKIEQSKFLWLLGKCPLIIKHNDLTEQALKLLKTKRIILICNSSYKLKQESVFETLLDARDTKLVESLCKDLKCLVPNELPLSKLIENDNTFKQIVTTDLLLEMIHTPFKLPVEKEEFSTIYIDRGLSKILIDINYLKSVDDKTLIVISGVDNLSGYSFLSRFHTVWVNELDMTFKASINNKLAKKPTVYLHPDTCPEKTFQEICSENTEMKKFHHFKIADDCLEWVSSQGNIFELQQYRLEVNATKSDCTNNVKILAGDPGLGKSWFLRKLKTQLSSSKFVVLFSTIDVKHIYECIRRGETFENFLVHVKYSHFNQFERYVLKMLMQTGQVVYLWDALDEIVNDEQFRVVTNFIYDLSKNSSVWLSCRRHIQPILERKFNVLSHVIREFSEKEKEQYINCRLKDAYKEKVISEIAGMCDLANFLTIPWQIFMLTELLLSDGDFLSKPFFLVDLYEYFIEQKFQILYHGKLKIDSNLIDLVSNVKRYKIRFLQKAAVFLLFDEEIHKNLKVDFTELLEDFHEDDPLGFIIPDRLDGKFKFCHKTYAEYFAACYLAKNPSSFYKHFLFAAKYSNVRLFFDMLLARECPAHQAVLCRNFEALKTCQKEELVKKDFGGRNVLQVACSWSERFQLLNFSKHSGSFILQENVEDIKALDLDLNYLEIIRFLLDENLDFNQDNCFEMSAFDYAKQCVCLFAIALIEKKLNILHFKQQEILSLSLYAILLCPDIFESVFNRLENIPDIKTTNDETLLHLVSQNGHVKNAKFLIRKGLDVNALNIKGFTPLYTAYLYSNEELALLLINNSANIDVLAKNGDTPLHVSSEKGFNKVSKLLIKRGAEVNEANKNGETPLYKAAENGHRNVAMLLIDNGADLNASNKFGATPIHVACENGHDNVVKLLIEKEASLHADQDNVTPLHVACFSGHEKVVKLLVTNKKINVDMVDKDGRTPLHAAAFNGNETIVQLLIDNGAKIDIADKDDVTPFYQACLQGRVKVVELLKSKMSI